MIEDRNAGSRNAEGPLILGLGGSVRSGSSTEAALENALAGARAAGARSVSLGAATLSKLPLFGVVDAAEDPAAQAFVAALRAADGLIIASPAYHGAMSGALKNAIDYIEETRQDPRPYLDALPVGLIVTAGGWQGAGAALASLRSVVHSLRGWPTPMGVTINTSQVSFRNGVCEDAQVNSQLDLVGQQVVDFAQRNPDRSRRGLLNLPKG